MKITDIYKQYPVNKGLQEHMMRVAAVAKVVCDHSKEDLDRDTIVSACLLHDMGNLLKIKLDMMPEALEPEGVEYWREKQAGMKATYGADVYAATSAIVKEINPAQKIIDTINAASFDNIEQVAEEGTVEAKVLEYADMRVGLHGVISLGERFDDLEARYVPQRFSHDRMERMRAAAKNIESELFTHSEISPSDITAGTTFNVQAELSHWEIKTY